ncbi:hypothetical protein NHG23_08430 [Aerococcaceae bacterium NML190073]|nr:hypothetical protein [Aerococcaceae bacterium NML190073]
MKKIILSLIAIFFMTACGSNAVSVQDLQRNEWMTNTEKIKGNADIGLKFYENRVDIDIDFEGIYQLAVEENPELAQNPLSKGVLKNYTESLLKQSAVYSLEGDILNLTISGPENEKADLSFKVKKDGKNIILTLNPANEQARENFEKLAKENGGTVEDMGFVLTPK